MAKARDVELLDHGPCDSFHTNQGGEFWIRTDSDELNEVRSRQLGLPGSVDRKVRHDAAKNLIFRARRAPQHPIGDRLKFGLA